MNLEWTRRICVSVGSDKNTRALRGVQAPEKYNFPTQGLRSKPRRLTCIFEVVQSSIRSFLEFEMPGDLHDFVYRMGRAHDSGRNGAQLIVLLFLDE